MCVIYYCCHQQVRALAVRRRRQMARGRRRRAGRGVGGGRAADRGRLSNTFFKILTCVRRAGAGQGARGRGPCGRSRRRCRRTSTPRGSRGRLRRRPRPPPAAAAAAPDPFDATHIAPSTTRLDSTRNSQRLTKICQETSGDAQHATTPTNNRLPR